METDNSADGFSRMRSYSSCVGRIGSLIGCGCCGGVGRGARASASSGDYPKRPARPAYLPQGLYPKIQTHPTLRGIYLSAPQWTRRYAFLIPEDGRVELQTKPLRARSRHPGHQTRERPCREISRCNFERMPRKKKKKGPAYPPFMDTRLVLRRR